jgi:uncharacterized membrane protein YqjE
MAEENKGLLDSLATLATTLVLYLIAAFCLVVGLVLAIVLTVFILWEDHRLLALSSVAGFFVLVGLLVYGFARHKTKTKPKLFSASLLELLKDQQSLNSR